MKWIFICSMCVRVLFFRALITANAQLFMRTHGNMANIVPSEMPHIKRFADRIDNDGMAEVHYQRIAKSTHAHTISFVR